MVVVRAAQQWRRAGVRNRRRGAWEEPDRRDWGLVVPAARSGLSYRGEGSWQSKVAVRLVQCREQSKAEQLASGLGRGVEFSPDMQWKCQVRVP